MGLRVHNTVTGELEPFEPLDPPSVTLYYCGLTVSDPAHLGHARSWVHVDVMHRWLGALGYDVDHVENFTDVNEKIVARVGEDDLGDDEAAVARTYIGQTIAAMRGLNLRRATVYPRVSEHIDEIVELVGQLIDRGVAYESNGSVYFDVTAFEGYGRLSNQNLEQIESQTDDDETGEKRHPADFALWKAGGVDPDAVEEHRHEGVTGPAPPGQTWSTPWGEGRPGWHIECSAMSMAHLGETIDIHVGGQDLVFPHHENEIAQSEAATGESFVRYWLHCALFEMDEEKMSSSLGNFVTVSEALERWGVNVLRTFLTAAAYNNRQRYTLDAIEEAEERWERLERTHEQAVAAADSVDAYATEQSDDLRTAVEEARSSFTDAMNDDFNTRRAQAALLEVTAPVHRHLEQERYDYQGLRSAIEVLEWGAEILGLSFDHGPASGPELADELIELLLDIREEERAAGEYDAADAIRADLEALGIEIHDTDEGPTYRRS